MGILENTGSLGFRGVTVSESPTRWECGAANPNKLGTPACYSRQFPKTQNTLSINEETKDETH